MRPIIISEDLKHLLNTLNPTNEEGKITLISRMGSKKIKDNLPNIIEVVKSEGYNVLWCCDPMHGNTIKTLHIKYRDLDDIFDEIQYFFNICKENNVYPGGKS